MFWYRSSVSIITLNIEVLRYLKSAPGNITCYIGYSYVGGISDSAMKTIYL